MKWQEMIVVPSSWVKDKKKIFLNFNIKNLQCVVDKECLYGGRCSAKNDLLSGWMLTLCECVSVCV